MRLAEFETQLGGFRDSLKALEGSASSSVPAEQLGVLSSTLQAMEKAASFEGEQNKTLVARLAEFATQLGGGRESLKADEGSSSSSASAERLEEPPCKLQAMEKTHTKSEEKLPWHLDASTRTINRPQETQLSLMRGWSEGIKAAAPRKEEAPRREGEKEDESRAEAGGSGQALRTASRGREEREELRHSRRVRNLHPTRAQTVSRRGPRVTRWSKATHPPRGAILAARLRAATSDSPEKQGSTAGAMEPAITERFRPFGPMPGGTSDTPGNGPPVPLTLQTPSSRRRRVA